MSLHASLISIDVRSACHQRTYELIRFSSLAHVFIQRMNDVHSGTKQPL